MTECGLKTSKVSKLAPNLSETPQMSKEVANSERKRYKIKLLKVITTE